VNTHLFHPKKDNLANRKIKLLHVSTLDDAHKNISGMLRVIAELTEVRQDFEFWFVGEGDTKVYVETAKNLGIYKSFVFFDGTKTTAQVADLMRSSDCFVMFSNYENLPCVIIEALASGIPVVSSTAGGVPEHVKDSMGLLVKPKDEKNLLASLIKAMDNINNHKYNADALNRYANDNFSYEKVSEKFITLYKNILAGKN
jgi:glycosyltransferase involved in cell wall biosynthesis